MYMFWYRSRMTALSLYIRMYTHEGDDMAKTTKKTGKLTSFHLRVDPALLRAAERKAKKEGTNVTALIRNWMAAGVR